MTLNNRQLNHPNSSQHRREMKIATHDGYIWPRPRAEMQYPSNIVERMAEDMEDLLKNRGPEAVIMVDDLQEIGWTLQHCGAYGRSARQLVRDRISQLEQDASEAA